MSGPRRNISQRSELLYDVQEYSINFDTREIYLHGYIEDDQDEEPGVDYRMTTNFVKNLHILSTANEKPILIHMMTCGGCWNFGMAIYDAIKACRNHVTILAYSHARSMSSLILQAADSRVLMPHADFLIHFGSLEQSGNYTSVKQEMSQSEVGTEQMLDVYVNKCKDSKKYKGRTEKYIRKQLEDKMNMKQEWYIDLREVINMNLADAVLGDNRYEDVIVLREADET